MNNISILFCLVFTFYSCNKSEEAPSPELEAPSPESEAQLLFSSGFELDAYLDDPTGDYEINNWADYKIMRGTDATTGYSWPIQILGSNFGGIHYVDVDGGVAVDNSLETVIGPTGASTKVLFQRIDYSIGVTQIPYQINNITQNPDELYMRYWMKIDDTSLVGSDKWRAIWEYKTNDYSNGNGFRMIAFINTDSSGRTFWSFQGDTSPTTKVWEKTNFTIPVPREEWFKVEYYFKWSNGEDGRALMKVNGQVIGEQEGPTTSNSKDLDFIILTQLYGNTHPMHQWIDEIEIWDGIPSQ